MDDQEVSAEATDEMLVAGGRAAAERGIQWGRYADIEAIYLAMKALDPDFATRTDTTEPLRQIRAVLADTPELNMSNFDSDQVAALNNGMIEVYHIVEATLATRTDSQSTDAVVDDARFLCERVRELETDMEDGVVASNYYGHVIPALARMESTLAALTSNPSTEHCGYVYEPDDSSKGEG
jgi:hypothetical protein